ncbi:MAG TPA: GWxTD domain-containing protein, partial [Gemmatimonadales bacterium]|nr:GWxTD domain-containing protein [Gemmatimonadales bacterium]
MPETGTQHRSSNDSAAASGGRATRAAFGLLLLVFTGTGRGEAQARQAWADLEHFQAELAAVSDTVQLRRSERAFGGRAASTQNEARRLLQRGLVRVRLGEMGDGLSFGRAARDFSGAADREPGWPFAWYARGVALRGQYQWLADDPMNIGKRVGFGSLEGAVDAFAEALRHDPGYVPALRALYEAAVTLRDTTRMSTIVLPALRAGVAAGVSDPEVLLALTRAERVVGDQGHAVEAAKTLVGVAAQRGLALHELAASALALGDSTGSAAYYAGAALDDSASVAAYREDLALIADNTALAEFDASRGDARAAWLREFWSDHGRASLRSGEERLREHYRRIAYAERHFGLEVNRRYYTSSTSPYAQLGQGDMYRSGSMRFDDRGIVYIRHGEPSARVLTVTYGIQPNETWTYRRADGDLLLHFAGNVGGDIHDLRLIPSVAAIGGVDAGNADNPATLFAFNDRCRVYAPYCKYLNWGDFGRQRIIREERGVVAASTSLAVLTDGQELSFSRPLGAEAKAFAVGQAGDRQLLHVAYQVALRRPDSLPDDAVFRTPLRVRVNLMDSTGRSRGWLDTTTVMLQQGGGVRERDVDAVGRVTMTAPAGHWYYRVAISYDDSTGRVIRSD